MDVKQSSVNMVPSKVEITLRKADQVAWGKLEDPNYKPEPEPTEESAENNDLYQPNWDIDDDDISDSDEDWAYDTPKKDAGEQKKKSEEPQDLKRKDVEEEMRRAMDERKKAEEERTKLEEQRRQEDEGLYEDMPELE